MSRDGPQPSGGAAFAQAARATNVKVPGRQPDRRTADHVHVGVGRALGRGQPRPALRTASRTFDIEKTDVRETPFGDHLLPAGFVPRPGPFLATKYPGACGRSALGELLDDFGSLWRNGVMFFLLPTFVPVEPRPDGTDLGPDCRPPNLLERIGRSSPDCGPWPAPRRWPTRGQVALSFGGPPRRRPSAPVGAHSICRARRPWTASESRSARKLLQAWRSARRGTRLCSRP